MAKQRTARQWASLLRRYRRSGLTQAAFCSRHGIALSTLSYQLRKLRAGQFGAAAPPEGPGPAPDLIELKLPSPAPVLPTGLVPPAAVRIDVPTPDGGPAVSIHCQSAQVGEILTQLPNLQPTCA